MIAPGGGGREGVSVMLLAARIGGSIHGTRYVSAFADAGSTEKEGTRSSADITVPPMKVA